MCAAYTDRMLHSSQVDFPYLSKQVKRAVPGERVQDRTRNILKCLATCQHRGHEGEKLKQDLHWWSSAGRGWGYFGGVTSLSALGELSVCQQDITTEALREYFSVYGSVADAAAWPCSFECRKIS